ncbi:hypothetical protein FBEOM_6309 [Fusarium beomiforme]|uniref:Uncharacterized protein n=1 Tax=Fusarium beomiforme TaxID=44412 RepID=A0A9P5AJA4_9HYPO|nr:hypothetical protein FBEOM_6309 [Fusarium beomiforme]
MSMIVESDLDSLLTGGDVSALSKNRASILEPAYESYLVSKDLRDNLPRASSVQLIPSSEIVVTVSRCPETGSATHMYITKQSDAFADNFIGYCPKERCVVFKGEGGLMGDFLDLAEAAASEKEVKVILQAPEQIRMPHGGLEYGLEYEDFVARVEVLECAMWLGDSPREREECGSRFTELAAESQLPQPTISKRMPTPDYVYVPEENSLSHEGPFNTNAANTKSPVSDCSSPLSDPPSVIEEMSLCNSSDSDSSLSSPGEDVETPPWAREWD